MLEQALMARPTITINFILIVSIKFFFFHEKHSTFQTKKLFCLYRFFNMQISQFDFKLVHLIIIPNNINYIKISYDKFSFLKLTEVP